MQHVDAINQAIQRYQIQDEVKQVTRSHEECINWLRRNNILRQPNQFICSNQNCSRFEDEDQPMMEHHENSKCDLRIMRCGNYRCRRTKSIRDGSILSGSRLPLVTLVRIIFVNFVDSVSINKTVEQTLTGRQCVRNIYSQLRTIVSNCMQNEYQNNRVGYEIADCLDHEGNRFETPAVEIDESLFTHFYQGGRNTVHNRQCWCLGMYDRSTNYCIPIMVGNNRTGANLLPIIQQYVMTGPNEEDEGGDDNRTRIYTDMWHGYNGLEDLDYQHWVVNHAAGWGYGHWNTNHIEGYWSVLKRVCIFNGGFNCESIEDAQTELDRGNWIIQRKRQNTNLVDDLIRMIQEYKQANPDFTINN